jgi:hypothetical protein
MYINTKNRTENEKTLLSSGLEKMATSYEPIYFQKRLS